MNAVVVRLERLPNKEINYQRKHDLRTFEKKLNYIDNEKTHLNSILVQPHDKEKLLEIVEKRRANRQRKMKKNTILLWRGIIGFGTEAQKIIQQLTKEDQNYVFFEITEAIAKYLNTDIESLVVHRDESSIHAHFTLYNHTRDNTTLSQKVKPQTLSQIQDIAANVLKQIGLKIGRGKKKVDRIKDGEPYYKYIHRTVAQLHRDLPHEYFQVKKTIELRKKELEDIEKRLEEMKRNEKELQEKIKTNEERIKKMQERIEKLQQEENEHTEKIAQMKKTLQAYERRKETAEKELERITKELEEITTKKGEIEMEDPEEKYQMIREKYYSLMKIIKQAGNDIPELKYYLADYPEFQMIFPEMVQIKENKENKENKEQTNKKGIKGIKGIQR